MSGDQDYDANFQAFHQRIHMAMVVTATFPKRMVILRCVCRDSVVLAYVARGEVQHTSMHTWN